MNRKLLKENAKIALKQNFWLVMLVVLVAQFIGVGDVASGGGGGGGGASSSYNEDSGDDYDSDYSFDEGGFQTVSFTDYNVENVLPSALTAFSVGVIVVFLIVVIVFAIAYSVFLVNPITVGYRKFFMLNRTSEGRFLDLFAAFRPKYMNIVKAQLVKDIYVFLWSLLFIIPGIIKSYEYFFVPFILGENPEISGKRAREISKSMTDGFKWKIFVLQLSFIGWWILAFILCIPAALLTCCLMGIGAVLVFTPLGGYIGATLAELYEERREYALINHFATREELCGFGESKNNDNLQVASEAYTQTDIDADFSANVDANTDVDNDLK